jgi:hypothetical protein
MQQTMQQTFLNVVASTPHALFSWTKISKLPMKDPKRSTRTLEGAGRRT